MTAPTADVSELLTWHSEVAEDNLYNDSVRRIHRMTVDALNAFAAVAAERDQARQKLADAWDEGAEYAVAYSTAPLYDNPYRSDSTP